MAESPISKAAAAVRNADSILITAGAGMGVDSGLPDFRGNEGFWKAYPPMQKLGLAFSQMSTPSWFRKDKLLAWGFFGHRYDLYSKTNPHRGFQILHNLCTKKGDDYFVFTSNVDGHFQKANFDANKIVECHGSIHYLQCVEPQYCDDEIIPVDHLDLKVDLETFKAQEDALPYCPKCKKLQRPNICMFNDYGWVSDRTDQQQDRFQEWIDNHVENKLVIIEIGAGLGVPTVRLTGEAVASQCKNSTLIRINVNEPHIPPNVNGIQLAMKGLEALEAIERELRDEK